MKSIVGFLKRCSGCSSPLGLFTSTLQIIQNLFFASPSSNTTICAYRYSLCTNGMVAIFGIVTIFNTRFLWTVLPAYLADIFGQKHVGAIHGRQLTAWSAAALGGPLLLSKLRSL